MTNLHSDMVSDMFKAFERCHTTIERGQWAETWIEMIKHVAELYEETLSLGEALAQRSRPPEPGKKGKRGNV